MSVYTPLNGARNEILPRSSDDSGELLNCKLCVHSLDDKLSYTALSYVWGDPKDTRTAMVNSHAMQLTIMT